MFSYLKNIDKRQNSASYCQTLNPLLLPPERRNENPRLTLTFFNNFICPANYECTMKQRIRTVPLFSFTSVCPEYSYSLVYC